MSMRTRAKGRNVETEQRSDEQANRDFKLMRKKR